MIDVYSYKNFVSQRLGCVQLSWSTVQQGVLQKQNHAKQGIRFRKVKRAQMTTLWEASSFFLETKLIKTS